MAFCGDLISDLLGRDTQTLYSVLLYVQSIVHHNDHYRIYVSTLIHLLYILLEEQKLESKHAGPFNRYKQALHATSVPSP